MLSRSLFTILAFIITLNVPAQNKTAGITLEECYALAEKNYPLIKRYSIIDKSAKYSLSNANKGYLPQLSLGAQATYQSEVISFPAELPVKIPSIPKDQYNASVTLNQIIWDGGAISSAKKLIKAENKSDISSLKADMYSIRERINNLFFGILLAGEQIKQTELFSRELEINYKNIESLIFSGVASGSDLDIIEVEQLKNRQRQKELEAAKESYMRMLSYFTGKEITDISVPATENYINVPHENRRPELEMFDSRLEMLQLKKSGINASVMPRFSFFAEGGYGNPSLNMLKPGWKFYGIGGIKLSWNFGSFYTKKGELSLIDNNRNSIENSKDIFLFNSNMEAIKEKGEIAKIKQLITDDDKIISLKEKIVKSARVKTENGTMTVNELLREMNSCNQARQTKIYHNIQLMMAVYNLKYTLNQ